MAELAVVLVPLSVFARDLAGTAIAEVKVGS
jgi:hypothetical protein